MASFNRVIIAGNLCRENEIKYFPSGMGVAENTIALNDKRKSPSGEWVDETSFIDVTFWGKSAETLNSYTRKGDCVLVEGRLKNDQWEKDGKKYSKLRVVCERFQILTSKKYGNQDNIDAMPQNPPSPAKEFNQAYNQAYETKQGVQNQTRPKETNQESSSWSNLDPEPDDGYSQNIPF